MVVGAGAQCWSCRRALKEGMAVEGVNARVRWRVASGGMVKGSFRPRMGEEEEPRAGVEEVEVREGKIPPSGRVRPRGLETVTFAARAVEVTAVGLAWREVVPAKASAAAAASASA
jgi:hypothetical protein